MPFPVLPDCRCTSRENHRKPHSIRLFLHGLRPCCGHAPFGRLEQENLRQWLAMVNAPDDGWSGVPKHVEKAFRAFLKCGSAFGFARAYCSNCQHSYIVPFSCKKRGVGPGCGVKHPRRAACPPASGWAGINITDSGTSD